MTLVCASTTSLGDSMPNVMRVVPGLSFMTDLNSATPTLPVR
jgi:hypothetical protein